MINIEFLNHMASFLAPSDTLIVLISEMVFYTFCIVYMACKLFNIARTKPAYSKESKLEERIYIRSNRLNDSKYRYLQQHKRLRVRK